MFEIVFVIISLGHGVLASNEQYQTLEACEVARPARAAEVSEIFKSAVIAACQPVPGKDV